MKLNFTKWKAAETTTSTFDCFSQEIRNPEGLSIRLADRRFGVGGDGVILICPSDVADAKMRMFNLDGSEGKMCGNGIRCVGKFVYDHGIAQKEEMTIETLAASSIPPVQARRCGRPDPRGHGKGRAAPPSAFPRGSRASGRSA